MDLAVLIIAILYLCGKCNGTVLAVTSIIFCSLNMIKKILEIILDNN